MERERGGEEIRGEREEESGGMAIPYFSLYIPEGRSVLLIPPPFSYIRKSV